MGFINSVVSSCSITPAIVLAFLKMKIFVALAALISAAYALTPSQVTCLNNGQGISVALHSDDYADWGRDLLNFGTCPFQDDGTATGGDGCGVVQSVDGSTIIYSIDITSSTDPFIITRRSPITVTVACSYDTEKPGQAASAYVAPTLDEILDTVSAAGSFELSLEIIGGDGAPVPAGAAFEVAVNDPVSVLAGGAGEGFNTRAVTCWSTSAADSDAGKYVLLEDSCPVDDTLELAAEGGDHKVTFKAFAYTADTAGSVFLHCDLVACPADDADCGVCATRKRRSATTYAKHHDNMMVKYGTHW